MQKKASCCRQWRHTSTGRTGFTLVEVCIALGIIAFAVLPLIGLLSIGLDSYRNAVTRARASQVLFQVATSLQNAAQVTSNTGALTGQYMALPPFPQTTGTGGISWTPAVAVATQYYTVYFDENGTFISDTQSIASSPPSNPPVNARIAAAVVVTTPTTNYDAGTAQITVGWPATPQSGPFYVTPSFSYGSVQGHVENTVKLPAISAQQ